MVSTGQMTGYIMTIFLPFLAGLVPYYIFWKRSSKIERGMLGAIGYGVAGYFWQIIIYGLLAGLALITLPAVKGASGAGAVLVAFGEAAAGGIFVTAALYWGVYLTNTKQHSLYRSATVGIGFGLGMAILNYGFPLYYVIKIKMGFLVGESAKASVLSVSTASLYMGALRNILFLVIYMGIAFLMGKNYLEKNYRMACLLPFIVYVFIRFTDVILKAYLPVLPANIIYSIILLLLAAASGWMVCRCLKDGSFEVRGKII